MDNNVATNMINLKPAQTMNGKHDYSDITNEFTSFYESIGVQFGYKRTGCCHALFTFAESVKHFVNNGSKVHCSVLDATKAFDKVLLNGLFLNLFTEEPPCLLLIVLYSDLQCAIVWNNTVGNRFDIKCVVR